MQLHEYFVFLVIHFASVSTKFRLDFGSDVSSDSLIFLLFLSLLHNGSRLSPLKLGERNRTGRGAFDTILYDKVYQ